MRVPIRCHQLRRACWCLANCLLAVWACDGPHNRSSPHLHALTRSHGMQQWALTACGWQQPSHLAHQHCSR